MCNNAGPEDYKAIIDKTVGFVKEHLKDAEGGHDWHHIERVWKNALHIAEKECTGNILIIELGALLHDIADAKFNNGDETLGPRIAGEFMHSLCRLLRLLRISPSESKINITLQVQKS